MQSVFEDLAALGGTNKALVSPLIPRYARPVPVAPQAVGFYWRHDPVDNSGEDGPALVRDNGGRSGVLTDPGFGPYAHLQGFALLVQQRLSFGRR